MIAINSAFPLYVVEDLEAQKRFYAEAFGFEAVFFDDTFYLHLINPANGIQLGFMKPNLPNQPEFLHPPATTQGAVITFEVANAAAAFEQAQTDALNVVFELKKESWNQTHFMVQDPAGLIIDIVEDANQPM